MGQTFVEKIFSKKIGRTVKAGEIVEVVPDVAMSHDSTADVSLKFKDIRKDRIYNPDNHVIILDHMTPAPNETSAANHKLIREFVRAYGINNFYDVNTGICHQVLVEEGFALPGKIIVGTDSHTTTYGAFGAFSTGIGRSEMAVIFATGKIWFRIPESQKITIQGNPPKGVVSKDIILHIIGDIGADGALYRSVEFYGDTLSTLSISGRMTISNMSVEMGAKNGVMEPDDKVIHWLEKRARGKFDIIRADPDAIYESDLVYDVSRLEPQIACPHTVDNVKPVSTLSGIRIDQAFLGSCTNGRLEDLEAAAAVLKDHKIHKDVRFLIYPASRNIYREALDRGYISTLTEAGATVMNAGCGPCLGAHGGVLAPGETCISTTNRNFKGRMGSPEADVYLASPASVAAAAIAGEIVDHRNL